MGQIGTQKALFGALQARCRKSLKKHSVGHFKAQAPGHSCESRPGSQEKRQDSADLGVAGGVPKLTMNTVRFEIIIFLNSHDFLDGNWESMEMKGRLRTPRR